MTDPRANPDFSWTRVDLFRCQFGCLPASDTDDRMEEVEAMRALAGILESGDRGRMPPPIVAANVLKYAAAIIEYHEDPNNEKES